VNERNRIALKTKSTDYAGTGMLFTVMLLESTKTMTKLALFSMISSEVCRCETLHIRGTSDDIPRKE
jgi:hypothetical protein